MLHFFKYSLFQFLLCACALNLTLIEADILTVTVQSYDYGSYKYGQRRVWPTIPSHYVERFTKEEKIELVLKV